MSVVKQACVALGIDPDHRFKNVGAKNPRKNEHGASRFKLDEAKAKSIRSLLEDDMHRFKQEFEFPVSKWGFD